MAKEDILAMKARELARLHVIKKVIGGDLSQVEATEVLGLGGRQVRRLVRRVEQEGDRGVIHRGRGRASNRAYPEKLKRKVIELYKKKYGDFGPTLFSEKLWEREAVGARRDRGWRRDDPEVVDRGGCAGTSEELPGAPPVAGAETLLWRDGAG